MNNKIITIKNVRAYQNENGVAQLNTEDVARGLGFTRVPTSGHEVIRWERVRQYLNEFGIATCCDDNSQLVGKVGMPEYIPENIFYKLCFKAKNEIARKFQDIVTDEVLPSIRKNGMYATDELLDNPDLAIKVFEQLKQEREEKRQLQLENTQQKQLIGELKPKADYTDRILQNKGLVTITAIAKDYGMSAKSFNKKLYELGVQFKQSKQWFLYSKYQECGYTHSDTVEYTHKDGTKDVTMNTKWTQKGRLFLYNLLKENNIVPVIERN